jgi:hypothetical protein
MFNQKYLAFLSALLLTTMHSCSEDKEEYTATFPKFVGLQAQSLDTGKANVLKAGKPFIVTAIESKQGKHLYQAHYYWTIYPADNYTQRYTSSQVYDAKAMQVNDTITVQNGGSYRVTLVASYDVAGIGKAQIPSSQRLPNNGGDISYKASTLKYVVTLSKVFQVQD